MTAARIPVIYIAGSGHSGTTLLDMMLDAHSAIVGVGEIMNFGRRSNGRFTLNHEGSKCSCTEEFHECRFWEAVGDQLDGRSDVAQLQFDSVDPEVFGESNDALFRAILDTSGASIVCDSSKSTSRLRAMLASERFDVHIVHLIRDGRAVGYSHVRKSRSPYPYVGSWQRVNLRYALLFARDPRYLRMHYLDLLSDWRAQVEQVLAAAGETFAPAQERFWEVDHHKAGGNHIAMDSTKGIKVDYEFTEALTSRQWVWSTLRGLIAVVWFGYPLRRAASRASHLSAQAAAE